MAGPRRLHLNYFHHHSGAHEAGWRHPDAEAEDVLGFEYLTKIARMCEDARLDSIFLPYGYTAQAIAHSNMGFFEDPLLALAAVAASTTHIGLVCTMSTTFNQPYDLAQRFATLDHLSHGRAGWNIVTSITDSEARNFGLEELPQHDARYVRADEFVEVCKKLWDSWEPDARVIDKAAGIYADTSKVHPINHVGDHYKVEGFLPLPRSPQRYPLLAQAGSSEAGRAFAAKHADAMFTVQSTLAPAREFYAEMKARAARHGRGPGELVIMPGLAWILGGTEEEARRRADELATEYVIPDGSIGLLSAFLKIDLRESPLDGPVPELPSLETYTGGIHRMRILYDYVAREQPTVRQLVGWFSNQMRGHGMVVGTAEQLADRMQQWLETEACDGFLLLPPVIARDLVEFCRDVVPILQERGVFRTEYEAATLRELYGVPVREPSGVAA